MNDIYFVNNLTFILGVIGHMIVAVLLFLLILFLINKFILKKKKITVLEVIIGWVIVLVLNIFCVVFDAPFGIGVPDVRVLDAGANEYYDSLGYTIHVYTPNPIRAIDDDSPVERHTSFEFFGISF